MKRAQFTELMESMQDALDHSRGKCELRTTVLPSVPPPITATQVRALRSRLNASQAVLARFLSVSTQLVQAWEAGRRAPDGAALRLLELGMLAPELVFAGLTRDSDLRRRERVTGGRSGVGRSAR